MKSSWIGIGFSHHRVPSLSNTAMRSSGATSRAVFSTKSTIALLESPSFHKESGSSIPRLSDLT